PSVYPSSPIPSASPSPESPPPHPPANPSPPAHWCSNSASHQCSSPAPYHTPPNTDTAKSAHLSSPPPSPRFSDTSPPPRSSGKAAPCKPSAPSSAAASKKIPD